MYKNTCCTEGALMASQLSHNFQSSPAVHGVDGVTSPHFLKQGLNEVPELILLFSAEGWSAQPYSTNFAD